MKTRIRPGMSVSPSYNRIVWDGVLSGTEFSTPAERSLFLRRQKDAADFQRFANRMQRPPSSTAHATALELSSLVPQWDVIIGGVSLISLQKRTQVEDNMMAGIVIEGVSIDVEAFGDGLADSIRGNVSLKIYDRDLLEPITPLMATGKKVVVKSKWSLSLSKNLGHEMRYEFPDRGMEVIYNHLLVTTHEISFNSSDGTWSAIINFTGYSNFIASRLQTFIITGTEEARRMIMHMQEPFLLRPDRDFTVDTLGVPLTYRDPGELPISRGDPFMELEGGGPAQRQRANDKRIKMSLVVSILNRLLAIAVTEKKIKEKLVSDADSHYPIIKIELSDEVKNKDINYNDFMFLLEPQTEQAQLPFSDVLKNVAGLLTDDDENKQNYFISFYPLTTQYGKGITVVITTSATLRSKMAAPLQIASQFSFLINASIRETIAPAVATAKFTEAVADAKKQPSTKIDNIFIGYPFNGTLTMLGAGIYRPFHTIDLVGFGGLRLYDGKYMIGSVKHDLRQNSWVTTLDIRPYFEDKKIKVKEVPPNAVLSAERNKPGVFDNFFDTLKTGVDTNE